MTSDSNLLVDKLTISKIADNYILSRHTNERICQRFTQTSIKDAILNNVLAYYNTDGSINIAINSWEYFVVTPMPNGKYKVITFKEKSLNNITIWDKYRLAIKGVDRKPYGDRAPKK